MILRPPESSEPRGGEADPTRGLDAAGQTSLDSRSDADEGTNSDAELARDDHEDVTYAAVGSIDGQTTKPPQASRVPRLLTFVLLPVLALTLAVGAGYGKYLLARHDNVNTARIESVAAAKNITEAMLSYAPDSAAASLGAAREQMTGPLRDSYTSLIDDVVIPGAQQKQISAVANAAAVASVSASEQHAVVLVFVDQSVTQGQGAPTATASTVRVTLDKVGTRWLASGFDPI